MPLQDVANYRTVEPIDIGWHTSAACQGAPDLFFPVEGEHLMEKQRRETLAKAICDTCPVRLLCRDDAFARRDLHGVRGGMSPDELASAYRSRMRAGLIPNRRKAA